MLPNFLIIGAPRSGTTHLYRGLRQHPAVFMSDFKEPMFFAYEDKPGPGIISDRGEYQALFEGAERYLAVGEASTLYLFSEVAPEHIYRDIPQARLIAILRNPVDRAFSQYTFQRFLQTEPCETFEEALQAEDSRVMANASPFLLYRRVGLYGTQIPRYLDRFSREQMLFVLQDDLDRDPARVFHDIFDFIGVDPTFLPDLRHRTNASGIPQHDTLFRTIKSAGRTVKRLVPERWATRLSGSAHDMLLTRPSMLDSTRASLTQYFHDDIEVTQRLIQRDLSEWLSP